MQSFLRLFGAAIALGATVGAGDIPVVGAPHAAAQTIAAAAVSATPIEPPTITDDGRALGDIVLGDPDAPVTIVEYASLTCPHCARFHIETYPTLKSEYIDTGLAKLVIREVYFDYEGLIASAIARCGGAANFYKFMDVILEQQRQWRSSGDRGTIVGELRRIGLLGGLPPERVDACISDQDYLRALAERYQQTASADEVEATPFFLVNGERLRGAVGIDEFREVVDAHLPN